MSRRRSTFFAAAALAAAAALPGAHTLGAQAMQTQASQIRKDLRALPNYGVFDLITFQVNPDGGVTLGGYVTLDETKREAARAIEKDKSMSAHVENKIEVAPPNPVDERLRHEVFTAVYRDSFLAHYGPASDVALTERGRLSAWGDGFRGYGEFSSSRWSGAPFYGQEPIGNYAIHILVNRGVVSLMGMVDSQEDKDQAGRDATRVHDVHTVNNDLHVKTK
jgi:osmotically-inducible protein OsmY